MRRAKIEDAPTLLKLARMVHFINLPADRDIIADKVRRSNESFQKAAHLLSGHPVAERPVAPHGGHVGGAGPVGGGGGDGGGGDSGGGNGGGGNGGGGLADLISHSDLFMFVLEDTLSGGVVGTSQIISRMGGPGRPNLSLRLSRKDLFSQSLQQGVTHIVAKLLLDESGPTEIGGLILQPSFRGHPLRLGRFLSHVRFHTMGLFRPLFADRVLAEMMGPVTPDGQNTLWEYLGRRFINLTYTEADRFCQYSKEFMISLLPKEEIYLTLLPPEARSVIAQVGPETVPARRMLEKLGFAYLDKIDPFDGGPNLEAATDSISVVRDTRPAMLGEPEEAADSAAAGGMAIVSVIDPDGEFRAVETPWSEDGQGRVRIGRAALAALRAEPGTPAGITAMAAPGRERRKSDGRGAHPTSDGAANGDLRRPQAASSGRGTEGRGEG